MEYMKDYDFDLAYHLSKANVVADVLSQKSYLASMITTKEQKMLEDVLDVVFRVPRQEGVAFVTILSVLP